MYDNVTGRWGTPDPLAEKMYSLTPYRFSLNNPVRFIDPDGQFELDKETAKKYPGLDNFLRNMLTDWNSKSDKFKNAFYETSSMNEQQVTEMLTYGKGPKIFVENLTVLKNEKSIISQGRHEAYLDIFGNATNIGSGIIKLDKNITVSYLENAITRMDRDATNILVESTIYHEGTHFGNTNKSGNPNGIYKESGKAFERRAYGQDIDERNFRTYYTQLYAPALLPKIKTNITLPYYEK